MSLIKRQDIKTFGPSMVPDLNENFRNMAYVLSGNIDTFNINKDLVDRWNSAEGNAKAYADGVSGEAKDDLAKELGYNDYADMVSKAKMEGKVLVEGGYLNTQVIETESIVAEMIAARAISVGKMRIGDFDNIIAENPNFIDTMEPHDVSRGDFGLSTFDPLVGKTSLYIPSGADGNTNHRVYFGGNHVVDVQPGEKYYVSIWVRRSGSAPHNDVRFGFRFMDKDRSYLALRWKTFTQDDLPGAEWKKISHTCEVPSGAAYMAPLIEVRDDGDNPHYRFDAVYCRKMLTGDLLVDGTITANILKAGDPDGAHLIAGEDGGDPFLEMHDENELRIKLLKDRTEYWKDEELGGYIKAEFIGDSTVLEIMSNANLIIGAESDISLGWVGWEIYGPHTVWGFAPEFKVTTSEVMFLSFGEYPIYFYIEGDLNVEGSISEGSSEKLKKNITRIEPSHFSEEVKGLNIYSFEKSGNKHRGLLVEDLRKTGHGNLVREKRKEKDSPGVYLMDYITLVAGATKELINRVERLENGV